MIEFLSTASAGLFVGLSLVVAIGAQNAFVLRQGMARAQVPLVVAICVASDIILQVAGVWGMGALLETAPAIVDAVKWLGVAFLVCYGCAALVRAVRRTPPTIGAGVATTPRAAVLACMALTWLNPGVYLDSVIMLGSLAASHGPELKWAFSAGAILASVLWYPLVGWGSHHLARLFQTPAATRALEGTTAAVMFVIGARVAGAF